MILILEWKWEIIYIEFITSFLRTFRKHDSIMVVVDNLTILYYFIPVKSTNSTCKVSQVLIRNIVRLHGIPRKIVSERDAKFISRFWKELFMGLGTKLAFNIAYHL